MRKACLLVFLLCCYSLAAHAQTQLPINSGVVVADVSQDQYFKVLLNANVTSFTLTTSQASISPGYRVNVLFVQDATGGRTVAFGAGIDASCTVASSANATTTCSYQWDTTANIWHLLTGSGGGGGASNLSQLNGGAAPSGQTYNFSAATLTLPNSAGALPGGLSQIAFDSTYDTFNCYLGLGNGNCAFPIFGLSAAGVIKSDALSTFTQAGEVVQILGGAGSTPTNFAASVGVAPLKIAPSGAANAFFSTLTVNNTANFTYTLPGSSGTICLTTTCTGTPAGVNDALQFNLGGAFGAVTPPTANGLYQCGYNVTSGAAVAPTCPQSGVGGRSITGATTTDLVAFGDVNSIINHDKAATGAVNETLPTGTTLGNSVFGYKYCNHSAQTDTLTPTTWTIQPGNAVAGATLSVPSGVCYFIHVDPNSTTNWLADASNVSAAGAVTSVSNSDGTLTITPTTGAVVASLALGHTNTWSATQTFPNASITAPELTSGILSCTEVWSGSGTSSALQAGDDAISNNTCYNDSGATRTITAVKCRSSAASNTTTVNPTFGSAGTGTSILSGALTCGSSYAFSAGGTISTSAWTTGTGVDPGMGGTLTGSSIALLIEYHY